MSSRQPLDALFAGYLHDLAELATLVVDEHGRGLRSARTLVGKLVLEGVRVSVYERVFLLPVLRAELPDGEAVVRAELAELDQLERRLTALEGLEPHTPAASAALEQVAEHVLSLARRQRAGVLPLLSEAMGDRDLGRLAEQVTPTHEPGVTHSHPQLPPQWDVQTWPSRGLVVAVRTAFLEEAERREGTLTGG